jgi:NADPH:quinone reductase-like Zn-dependent oxidoreductase
MALMRRQSLVKFDAPLCETIVETPKPQGKEVLVRIERCGLCHSDLHIQDGYADLGGGKKLDTTRGMTLPFTLGHEIAGIVEEVGPDVSKDLIGAKKAVFPGSAAANAATVSMATRISAPSSAFSASPSTAVSPAMCWCRTQNTCWITIRCRSIRRRP